MTDRRTDDDNEASLAAILNLLEIHTGHDFSKYKKGTLNRRIAWRMSVNGVDTLREYAALLEGNTPELEALFMELLICVTRFFRNSAAWRQLEDNVLPDILTKRQQAGAFRAWVIGCATGEEAYSLAIIVQEVLDRIKPRGQFNLQIFATDLRSDLIDRARKGLYSAKSVSHLAPQRIKRFFTEEDGGTFRVNQKIREMVVLAPQNLLSDPPFGKLDIVVCRNVLIYLQPQLQQKVIPLFHYILNPGGILFLGSAETIGAFPHLFEPLDRQNRIFKRVEPVAPPKFVEFPPY